MRDGKETIEDRYYISSLAVGVKRFARAVRSHWGIENSCHWSLDMTYREDESRIRERQLRENFAWLNRFTLSLLKQHPGTAQHRHETPQLRLERRLLAGSPYRINMLVCAGPGQHALKEFTPIVHGRRDDQPFPVRRTVHRFLGLSDWQFFWRSPADGDLPRFPSLAFSQPLNADQKTVVVAHPGDNAVTLKNTAGVLVAFSPVEPEPMLLGIVQPPPRNH